ncbi:MAG: ATP-binding protein [Muribaculaceae bacterium]|nr:ATP-binding protein [Muribaculaceae bacterium]
MAFEVGKLYTFKESEFEKSRESGKLVFKVRDPASATPYIVKPFEFQITDIPDKIVCLYKGNDRFEQDLNSVVPEIYEVGKEYRFRVMRQDTNSAAHVSVRDDARGLTFYPIDLGKVKFERFQRITCKVVSTDKGQLRLEYVKEQEAPAAKFSVADIRELRGARLLSWPGFFSLLRANPVFDDARGRFDEGNPEWLLVAMESVTNNIPMWFRRMDGFHTTLLGQVKELALSLIERSEYLNRFPMEERRRMQGRLSEVILECEDYLHAARLIEDGEDVEFITQTLASLRSTGWLYKPEKKMRLMMALFTLKNSYVHDYIWEIFKVIRDHHADMRFLGEFADGFILMLRIFIDNESKFVNTSSHDALRELIEAIAILLLLTRNKEYARWNLYRGRLYTLAMLLIGKPVAALAEKAVGALTENLDMPLEYGWKDLDDVNRLCYANLSGLYRYHQGASRQKSLSTFEGQNASLTVKGGRISVAPVVTGASTREALSVPLSDSAEFSVCLNGRLDGRTAPDDINLSRHHVMWKELENSLFDPDKKVAPSVAPKAVEVKKLQPVVDDEVTFRVVGREDVDQFTFGCVIEDPVYEGAAVINTRDIVLYPVSPHTESFWLKEGPMLFRGRVIGVLPDGRFRLSMEKEVDEEIMRLAKEDREEEAQMEAVITKELGESCLAVSDGGYPVLIYKNGEELRQGQKVMVTVNDIGWNKKNNKPYIAARFEEHTDENNPVENYRAVRDNFHYLLTVVSGGKVWVDSRPKSEAADCVEEDPAVDRVPDNYLTAEAVNGLSRVLDAMAFVSRDNITETYTLLASARLLALLAGDTYRAQFLELKQAMVEGLARFVIDGRVDRGGVAELARRVEQFPGNDADLASRMEILRTLSLLDAPAMGEAVTMPDDRDSSLTGALKRMVVSYNMLRGLKLNSLRQELKRSIYDLLRLRMPDIDVSRVNACEDQHHEFKESLVYPAGNNMKPDEKKQGLEIAQVICGMLNTEGGTLYIGVANSGVPRGLVNDFVYINNGFEEYDLQDVKDKFSLRFCKVLRDQFGLAVEGTQIYPSLVALEFDDIDDHCFAVVSVKPFNGVVRMADGSVFVRQDTSTLPVKKKSDQLALEKVRKSKTL